MVKTSGADNVIYGEIDLNKGRLLVASTPQTTISVRRQINSGREKYFEYSLHLPSSQIWGLRFRFTKESKFNEGGYLGVLNFLNWFMGLNFSCVDWYGV